MKKISAKQIKSLKGFPDYIVDLKGKHNAFDYGIVVSALYEYKNLKIFYDDSELKNAKDIATNDCAREIIKRRKGEVEGKIDILDYSIRREAQVYCDYFSRIRKGIAGLGDNAESVLYALISRKDYGNQVSPLSEYTLEAFADCADVANEILEYMKKTENHSDVFIAVVGKSMNFDCNSEMGN